MRIRLMTAAVVAVGLVYVGCGGPGGGTGGGSGTLAAPSNLAGTPMGSGVHLTWTDNSSNEESFELERATATSSYVKVATVAFDTTQHHDQGGLTGGESYTYRVRASGGGSFSTYSNTISAVAPGGGGGAGGGLAEAPVAEPEAAQAGATAVVLAAVLVAERASTASQTAATRSRRTSLRSSFSRAAPGTTAATPVPLTDRPPLSAAGGSRLRTPRSEARTRRRMQTPAALT